VDQITQVLGNMDAVITLWIAGIVAAIFVFLIVYDSVKRSRKRARLERGYRAANPLPGRFARMREGYRTIKEEAKKRQRRSARMRKVNDLKK
jgi:uncharacterized membrane protein